MAENSDKPDPSWPPIEQGERTLYEILFYSQGPVDGYILGDAVRDLFLKSGLPLTVLSQIWNLADVSHDNVLSVHEFSLVMHLIRGVLRGLPTPQTLPRNLTLPKSDPVTIPPMTQRDREAYLRVFQALDHAKSGYIDGPLAVEVLRSSQLTDELLAPIWDLADFGRDGRLSEEEFYIACHLVRFVKQGGQLSGPVDIFRYAPERIAQQSLLARKQRVAKYEEHKQKLMIQKERRKCQADRESRRLNLAKSKVQIFQELYGLLTSLDKGTEAETVLKQTIPKEEMDIAKQEEIVDRLKKEHEKVRQETVKIILGEQKFNSDISSIKRDTDELNKRLLAIRTHATKDPDPFHQLYEQRREKRQGSTIKDLDKIEVHLPFWFSPFDLSATAASLPSGATVLSKGDNSSLASAPNIKALLSDLKEFGEQFMETWADHVTEKSKAADDDEIFQEVYDWSEDNWPGWDWSRDGLLGLTNHQVVQLKAKLTDLKEAIHNLNSEGGRLVFKNPEDYTARQRAREEAEKDEKIRVPRRSITDRPRTGISGTGRTRDAPNRYSYAGERSNSVDTQEVAKAAREYRLSRRSQIIENSDVQKPDSCENLAVSAEKTGLGRSVVSNPDKSTLTIKTSRRKDDLSIELASIALGRRIQVEEIPVPVSAERGQKSDIESTQGKRTLSRSRSEEIQLIEPEIRELSIDHQIHPHAPARSSKKVKAPEPPVSVTASASSRATQPITTDVHPLNGIPANHKGESKSKEPIQSQEEVYAVKPKKDPLLDEKSIQKGEDLSTSAPQRPPRLKKRLGSPEASLEIPPPESQPIKTPVSERDSISFTNDYDSSIPRSSLYVQQSSPITNNTNLGFPESIFKADCIPKEQSTVLVNSLSAQDTLATVPLNQKAEPVIPQQVCISPDSNLSELIEVLEDIIMPVSKVRVDIKLPSNARIPEPDDDVPPPLPNSPPPLPSSAPPSLAKGSSPQKVELIISSSNLVDLEEVTTVEEYTISLTAEQRREMMGHNSSATSSQAQDLSDFDPLSQTKDSKTNGAPPAVRVQSNLLIDFGDGTPAFSNEQKTSSDKSGIANNSEDFGEYTKDKSPTFSPGDSGHLTSSFSSASDDLDGRAGSPARPTDSPESGFHETLIISSSSSAKLSSRPKTLHDEETSTGGDTWGAKKAAGTSDVTGEKSRGVVPAAREEGVLSPKSKELMEKAKHFAEMVQPKVVVRRESGGQGEFSQDTLQILELQRRAIISESAVKRKVNVTLSPSADLDSTTFQETVQPKVVIKREKDTHVSAQFSQDTRQSLEPQRRPVISESAANKKVNSTSDDLDTSTHEDSLQSQLKGSKSANPSEYGYTYSEDRPAPPPEVGWVDRPSGKVNLYSENVLQEGNTTEEINRESIANLSTTKKQWEDVFKTQGTNQSDSSTLKKKTTPKWEVRLPYKEKPSAPPGQGQEQQEAEEVKMPSKPVVETESAIEREIRLAHEREEMLRREKELRQKTAAAEKPKGQGQAMIASYQVANAESESYHPAYNELTEADRGPELWGVGSNRRHQVEEEEDEADQEKKEVNPNESIIEREIRLQREREQEIASMRQKKMPVVNNSHEPPAQVKVQPAAHEQVADVNHNHKEDMSYEESTPPDTESLIAKELRELREREEEIRRMHKSFHNSHIQDDHDGHVNNQKPSSLGLAKNSTSSHSSPSPGQGTWQKDVSPFLVQKRRESQDSTSSHSTGRTPSESTPTSRNIKVHPMDDSNAAEEKPNYFKKQETPIEREMRLARERENELRRQKGLPEVQPHEDDFYSSYSPGSENNLGGSSSAPRPFSQPSDSMKKFASNRLQQELNQQKERELTLRSEGKIISTSEEHIEPLRYMEVAGVDKVDGKEKRNFVTKRSSVVYEPEVVTPTQSDAPASTPGKKTSVAAGGQLFSYKEFKQTAESKIERELREMREREEELRNQRKEVPGDSAR